MPFATWRDIRGVCGLKIKCIPLQRFEINRQERSEQNVASVHVNADPAHEASKSKEGIEQIPLQPERDNKTL
jgi:hypothetical protein